MKTYLACSLCGLYITTSLVSCYNPHSPSQIKAKSPVVVTMHKKKGIHDSNLQQARVYTKGDSSCVIVDNKTLCISTKYKIDLTDTYPFICQVKNHSIKRSRWLIWGDFTLISIEQGTGRGYTQLYVIDNKTQKLVTDKRFNRDYLSGFGIFVVEGNSIFTMHKTYYNEKSDIRSAGSLYAINNNRFVYIKSRVQDIEIGYDDTATVSFSRKPLNKKY
jgi:hypothetical protein